jgi:hypothetical protein
VVRLDGLNHGPEAEKTADSCLATSYYKFPDSSENFNQEDFDPSWKTESAEPANNNSGLNTGFYSQLPSQTANIVGTIGPSVTKVKKKKSKAKQKPLSNAKDS